MNRILIVTANLTLNPLRYASLIGVLVISVGCAAVLEPIIYAKRGGMSPATEDAMTKPCIDADIQRELAGEKPLGKPTWHAYWQLRYEQLRENISNGHIDSQRFIDYIHQKRAAAGLPLYDDKVSSTEKR